VDGFFAALAPLEWRADGSSRFCFTLKNKTIQNKTGMGRMRGSGWVGCGAI